MLIYYWRSVRCPDGPLHLGSPQCTCRRQSPNLNQFGVFLVHLRSEWKTAHILYLLLEKCIHGLKKKVFNIIIIYSIEYFIDQVHWGNQICFCISHHHLASLLVLRLDHLAINFFPIFMYDAKIRTFTFTKHLQKYICTTKKNYLHSPPTHFDAFYFSHFFISTFFLFIYRLEWEVCLYMYSNICTSTLYIVSYEF